MKHSLLILFAILMLSAMTTALAQDPDDDFVFPPEEFADAEPFPLVGWPDGDVDAGKEAFADLKCTQCHLVPSVPELAKMHTGEGPGPELTKRTEIRPRLVILRQIVAPGADSDTQASHMGNFAEVMTVQQLTDLITFIEHVEQN